ncbi:unnamed protein product [Lampetra fluviatilis]
MTMAVKGDRQRPIRERSTASNEAKRRKARRHEDGGTHGGRAGGRHVRTIHKRDSLDRHKIEEGLGRHERRTGCVRHPSPRGDDTAAPTTRLPYYGDTGPASAVEKQPGATPGWLSTGSGCAVEKLHEITCRTPKATIRLPLDKGHAPGGSDGLATLPPVRDNRSYRSPTPATGTVGLPRTASQLQQARHVTSTAAARCCLHVPPPTPGYPQERHTQEFGAETGLAGVPAVRPFRLVQLGAMSDLPLDYAPGAPPPPVATVPNEQVPRSELDRTQPIEMGKAADNRTLSPAYRFLNEKKNANA